MKKELLLLSLLICFSVKPAEQDQKPDLHKAIATADLKTVTELLQQDDIDVNAIHNSQTPLIAAAVGYLELLNSKIGTTGSMSSEDLRKTESVVPSAPPTNSNQFKILKALSENSRTTVTEQEIDQFTTTYENDNMTHVILATALKKKLNPNQSSGGSCVIS